MLWPIKFAFKVILRLKLIAVSVLAGMAIAFYLQLREQQKSWGIVPADRSRALAGDDLVVDPTLVETRSLSVAAPASKIWPWLVQMGYGRGGWYSYDTLDPRGSSPDAILPQFQDLAVGDSVPTQMGWGFVAKVIEPQNALVLYVDSALVKSQVEAMIAEKGGANALDEVDEEMPGGLPFAGAMGDMTMPEFRASWAFILEPEAGGTTRLIERLRVWTADAGLQKVGMPVMGIGVFAMTRKHMLGVKERAEASSNGTSAPPEPQPAEV